MQADHKMFMNKIQLMKYIVNNIFTDFLLNIMTTELNNDESLLQSNFHKLRRVTGQKASIFAWFTNPMQNVQTISAYKM
jgi:ribosomal protein L5